jgi:hypothetical protein
MCSADLGAFGTWDPLSAGRSGNVRDDVRLRSAESDSGDTPRRVGDSWARDSRRECLNWLGREAVSLAELYEGSARLLDDVRLPGRVRFISHAVREIRNRLPDIIAGPRRAMRLDYPSRIDELRRTWAIHDPSFGGEGWASTSEDRPTHSRTSVEVPLAAIRCLVNLITDHDAARERPRDAARRLFEAISPGVTLTPKSALDVVIRQWLEVTDWFMHRAHDSGKADNDCDDAELRRQFELFELSLASLVRTFFATVESLDEILDDANA